MMIQNLNQLSTNNRIILRKIQKQYYLIVGSSCYEINNTGASIVNVIGQDLSIQELCKKISVKYNFTDIAVIERNLIEFISFLIDEGVISINEPG